MAAKTKKVKGIKHSFVAWVLAKNGKIELSPDKDIPYRFESKQHAEDDLKNPYSKSPKGTTPVEVRVDYTVTPI